MKFKFYYVVLIIFLAVGLSGFGQSLSLQYCWDKSRENYPLNNVSIDIIQKATGQKLKNINSSWYPQFALGAQASWQSDVPHVDIDNPMFDFPIAPKDQYKAFIDINQIIYDGGFTRKNKELVNAQGGAQKQDVETKLREVKSRVTDIYFSLLILREQKQQLVILIEDLDARVREINSAVKNGVVHITELSMLELEKMNAEKQYVTLALSEKSLFDILSLYTGTDISINQELETPDEDLFAVPQIRPELTAFALQQEQFKVRQELSKVAVLPKLAAFAQGGYGNPALNMLKDEFAPFYVVGLRLQWQPWDWKTTSRNKKVFALESDLAEQHENSFIREMQRTHFQINGELEQYKQKMEKDSVIVSKHRQIVSNYQIRLKNGAITSADYIAVINAASRAQLEMEVNRLQYLHMLARQYLVGFGAK